MQPMINLPISSPWTVNEFCIHVWSLVSLWSHLKQFRYIWHEKDPEKLLISLYVQFMNSHISGTFQVLSHFDFRAISWIFHEFCTIHYWILDKFMNQSLTVWLLPAWRVPENSWTSLMDNSRNSYFRNILRIVSFVLQSHFMSFSWILYHELHVHEYFMDSSCSWTVTVHFPGDSSPI